MNVDDQIQALIHGRAAEAQIFAAAEASGLKSMREDGERLVAEGITSAEVALRMTNMRMQGQDASSTLSSDQIADEFRNARG